MKGRFTLKRFISTFTSMLLSFTLIFNIPDTVFAEERELTYKQNVASVLVEAAISMVAENYKYGVDELTLYKHALRQLISGDSSLMAKALEGVYGNLDKHSTYFTKEEFKQFVEELSGEFCGIGVTIMEFEEGLLVTEVHANSPADKAGLRQGDIIVSADGVDIRGMAVEISKSYIIGVKGTSVKIGIIRDGASMTFDIVRDTVTTEPGFYQVLDGNIGYIQLSGFDDHSDEFMLAALTALEDTKNIILDLRYNPGGSLAVLQSIAGCTLPKGPVLHLDYADGRTESIDNPTDGSGRKFVVIVNEGTASAAEAFSAAVQDYNAGVVVGEQTFGKGTMQIVNGFITGDGYKLTVAEYLSPDKRIINDIGVEPDYGAEPRIVKYSDIYYTPVTFDRVLRLGDEGDDVLAFEERLDAMGLSVGIPDRVFDDKTFYAVRKYQEIAGLYPYGVLDITTQLSIHSYLQDKEVVLDEALDKAIEIASGDLDEYVREAAAEREAAAKAKALRDAEKAD